MAGTNPAVVAVFARALTTFSHNRTCVVPDLRRGALPRFPGTFVRCITRRARTTTGSPPVRKDSPSKGGVLRSRPPQR